MEVIGTTIAITQVAYFAACTAVDGFNAALRYFDDAEALSVAVELERLRLETWGTNSGLANNHLEPVLVLAGDVLERQLKIISRMFGDAHKLRERYGVEAARDTVVAGDATSSLVARMRHSLRASGVRLYSSSSRSSDKKTSSNEADERWQHASQAVHKRARWVIRDKDELTSLVGRLRTEIDVLNKLLTETQQTKAKGDHERIRIVAIGSVVDEKSLSMVMEALDADRDFAAKAMAHRKALVDSQPWTAPIFAGPGTLIPLHVHAFNLPSNYAERARFITSKKQVTGGQAYMFERKQYDPDIDPASKSLLLSRIQRLVLLLSMPRSTTFRVLQIAGYAHEVENHCWWLIFHFPVHGLPTEPIVGQPTTLLDLLRSSGSKNRPPLEKRFALANHICMTLHELYASGWLHKSISSHSVFFAGPAEADGASHDLDAPFICGLEYTRHETEAQTIDRARTAGDISIAMYRHPDYQGEAAQGYRLQHDVYSLGLVLLEIGLWAPLNSLFDPKPPKSSSDLVGGPRLWRSMGHFHTPEAKALRVRAISTVEKDLPFRMGSAYASATKWCLTFDNQSQSPSEHQLLHPALDFYNHVVEPLGALTAAYQTMVNFVPSEDVGRHAAMA
jgi:hypothetical protein